MAHQEPNVQWVLDFRESVAGFEREASSHDGRRSFGSAGRACGSADVASQSRQDGESSPGDEVRGGVGLMTHTHKASHSHREV